MFDNLILWYVEYFNEEKNDGWRILCGKVNVSVLHELYLKFMKGNEVPPIENLELNKKQKYWDIAGKYYSEKEQRVRATKAAYVLSLITSNE